MGDRVLRNPSLYVPFCKINICSFTTSQSSPTRPVLYRWRTPVRVQEGATGWGQRLLGRLFCEVVSSWQPSRLSSVDAATGVYGFTLEDPRKDSLQVYLVVLSKPILYTSRPPIPPVYTFRLRFLLKGLGESVCLFLKFNWNETSLPNFLYKKLIATHKKLYTNFLCHWVEVSLLLDGDFKRRNLPLIIRFRYLVLVVKVTFSLNREFNFFFSLTSFLSTTLRNGSHLSLHTKETGRMCFSLWIILMTLLPF